MRKIHFLVFLTLGFMGIWTVSVTPIHAQNAAGALAVPLTVSNTLAVDRFEPVTSGVPIPRDLNLTDLTTLRLLDAGGNPVPAQFTPLARWGGAPDDTTKPVRWLLLDFQASVPAGGIATFTLVNSGGNLPVFPTLTVTDIDAYVAIDTGAAIFHVDKASGYLSEPSLTQPLLGEIIAGGRHHVTSGAATVTVTLNGPMRVAVEVRGAYRADDGTALLDHTTRYWFFAGSPLARIFHTVENNTPCPLAEYAQLACHDIGSGGSVTFDDLTLTVAAPWSESYTYQWGQLSGALDNTLLIYQDSSGTDYWNRYATFTDWDGKTIDTRPRMQAYVNFRGYRATLGDTELASGDQAIDTLTISGDNGSLSVGVRNLWQNFPKALRVVSGLVQIGLFPGEFGGEDYNFTLRAGEHKTHEIWLLLNGALPDTIEPLFAQASPEWYVNSGAFGLTALPNSTDWPDHENYIQYQLDAAPAYQDWMDWRPNLFETIRYTDFYGIFDYGDWPIDYEGYGVSPLSVKYDMDFGAWLQWARGGDPRWFAVAEVLDRHFADIDILHNHHEPRHWGDGMMFGHSYHDEAGFINPHRNYGGAAPDIAYGMHGLLVTYYLTGYEKAYESAMEMAEGVLYRFQNDYQLCDFYPPGECNGEGWALQEETMIDGGARPAANGLGILVAAYRATGDERYLRAADAIVNWARPARQPFINGPTGEDQETRPWVLNMYLRQVAYYLEMRNEFGLADTQGAGADYLAFITWLRTYAWLDPAPIATGARGAYPYSWWFDGRQGDPNDEYADANNIPSINNWLLVGADALAYAYRLSGDTTYLDYAEILFRTGTHNPFFIEEDMLMYTTAKETANAVIYGNIFLYEWENR